jgi:hypothetical protein
VVRNIPLHPNSPFQHRKPLFGFVADLRAR